MRRLGKLAFLGAALALVAPVTAGATQLDTASATKALRALDGYLLRQDRELGAWKKQAVAYIASISAGCPKVLAPLGALSASATMGDAVTNFAEETGGDLGAEANLTDSANSGRLARTLRGLHWSRRATGAVVARYVKAELALGSLRPSDLCGDATALAASSGQTTPPGTQAWLADFNRKRTAAAAAEAAYQRVLRRFRTPGDRRLNRAINRLESRLGIELGTFTETELPNLLTALGLTTS